MEQVQTSKHWNWYAGVQVKAGNRPQHPASMACGSTASTLRKYRSMLRRNAPRVDAHPSVESERDPAKLAEWAAAVASPCSATDSQDLLFPCPQHKQVRLQGLYSCWISNSHFYPPDFLLEKTKKIRSGCGPRCASLPRTRN